MPKTLDERRLFAALKRQGFDVAPNGSQVKIVAPTGHPLHFHRSTFQHGDDANRSYRNAFAELVRAGFDPDAIEPRGGVDEKTLADRAALAAQLEAQDADAAQASLDEAARRAVEADRHAQLEALPAGDRALYDRIAANPGRAPREYAEVDTANGRQAVSQHGTRLIAAGLIEGTGNRKSRRYHLAGAVDPSAIATVSAAGQPGAGIVRTRTTTPADPLVAYRRLVQRIADRQTETAELVKELVDIHEQTHRELLELRAKVRRVESVLGRAIDAL